MQSPFCCVTNRFFVVSFSNDSNKILLLWRNEKACIFKPIGFGKCQLFSHMALSPKLHLLTINSLLLFTIFFYLKRKPFSREKFGATKTAKLVTMLWWPSHWNWFRTLYLSQSLQKIISTLFWWTTTQQIQNYFDLLSMIEWNNRVMSISTFKGLDVL